MVTLKFGPNNVVCWFTYLLKGLCSKRKAAFFIPELFAYGQTVRCEEGYRPCASCLAELKLQEFCNQCIA